MSIGSFIKRAVPVAIAAATGGPVAAFATASTIKNQDRQARNIKRQNEAIEQENQRRREQMATYYDQRGGGFVNTNLSGTSTSGAGFGSSFGTFLGDVGRNIISPISSVARQVLPFFGSRDSARQPAQTRVPILGGSELQTTGTNEAFIGSIPNVLGQASRFLGSRSGQIGIGTAVGGALFSGGDGGTKMRVTRKTKRLAQQAYSLAMGDLGTATQLFEQLSGLSVDERTFVLILTKRFRNDGAVITKAALRKTRRTIHRLKGMCDMYDSLRKAPVRRRTPMKRAVGTTLISNK